MTNAEKFEEVFGFPVEPLRGGNGCTYSSCDHYVDCKNCPKYDFWNQEYKEVE